ncbi:MAG: hypothetical protein HYX48_04780 [Chlamydiales bacterium]|nr:hypothetical protein [Chlamydiales bacterium]
MSCYGDYRRFILNSGFECGCLYPIDLTSEAEKQYITAIKENDIAAMRRIMSYKPLYTFNLSEEIGNTLVLPMVFIFSLCNAIENPLFQVILGVVGVATAALSLIGILFKKVGEEFNPNFAIRQEALAEQYKIWDACVEFCPGAEIFPSRVFLHNEAITDKFVLCFDRFVHNLAKRQGISEDRLQRIVENVRDKVKMQCSENERPVVEAALGYSEFTLRYFAKVKSDEMGMINFSPEHEELRRFYAGDVAVTPLVEELIEMSQKWQAYRRKSMPAMIRHNEIIDHMRAAASAPAAAAAI